MIYLCKFEKTGFFRNSTTSNVGRCVLTMFKIILILGAYQALVFAVFLLVGSIAKKNATGLLGLFFTALFIHHGTRLILETNLVWYQYVEFVTFPAVLVLFPLFYMYVRRIVGLGLDKKTVILHLAPSILFVFIYSPLYAAFKQIEGVTPASFRKKIELPSPKVRQVSVNSQ